MSAATQADNGAKLSAGTVLANKLYMLIFRMACDDQMTYHKASGISRTKYQNLNVSCILLQLSLLNPLKPGVNLRMKM